MTTSFTMTPSQFREFYTSEYPTLRGMEENPYLVSNHQYETMVSQTEPGAPIMVDIWDITKEEDILLYCIMIKK